MDESAVATRAAVVDDLEGLVRLSAGLFAEDAGRRDPYTDLGWPEDEGLEYFAAAVADEGVLCLVAECGGEAVGYLVGRFGGGTSVRPVAVAELESVYVRAEFRGIGVGSRLAREFLGWAGVRGARLASVTAHWGNERARAFYEREGFAPKSVTLERGV